MQTPSEGSPTDLHISNSSMKAEASNMIGVPMTETHGLTAGSRRLEFKSCPIAYWKNAP
mgnify:CR=1 FL=1